MSVTWSWICLFIAALFEVLWVIGLKYSEGFSKLIPSIFTLITLSISMYLLAKASEIIPIGVAYAVWVGIGALGATIAGIVLFNESAGIARYIFMSLLLISIVGLKLTVK